MVGSEPGLRNCNIWSNPMLMLDFRLVSYAIFVVSVITGKLSHWCRMYPLPPVYPSTKHLFQEFFFCHYCSHFEVYYSVNQNHWGSWKGELLGFYKDPAETGLWITALLANMRSFKMECYEGLSCNQLIANSPQLLCHAKYEWSPNHA